MGNEAGQGTRAAMKKLDFCLVQQDAGPNSNSDSKKPITMPTTLRPRRPTGASLAYLRLQSLEAMNDYGGTCARHLRRGFMAGNVPGCVYIAQADRSATYTHTQTQFICQKHTHTYTYLCQLSAWPRWRAWPTSTPRRAGR